MPAHDDRVPPFRPSSARFSRAPSSTSAESRAGSSPHRRGGVRIRDPKAAAFALVLGILGTLTTTLGLTTEDSAPPPTALTIDTDPTSPKSPAGHGDPAASGDPTSGDPARGDGASGTRTGGASPSGTNAGEADAGMRRSEPVRLRIPGIGVDTALMSLGLRADGTLQVPPLRGDAPAGWYRNSPTPGEVGASVLVGHVDSARDGPAVFFRLREVEVGDPIAVRRKDGTVAHFEVSRVAVFAKREFPSAEVYAALDRPGLRLITCGGVFDRGAGSYESNVVVFADPVT